MYWLFYTDVSITGRSPDFNRLYPVEYSTAAEALDAALRVIDVENGIAWKIEGAERGTIYMDRNAIRAEYYRRTGKSRG